jgi:hypothetical protein
MQVFPMLKRKAALGFRAHSGWAALIALAEPVAAPLVIRRCRIELTDRGIVGSMQPYHTAGLMPLNDAETYLRSCSNATAAMAREAVRDALAELSDYQVAGACVLLASGRPLPGLAGILSSHALIHTAEGEFYRAALREACECCGLPETGIKERDLAPEAAQAFGRSTEDLQSMVVGFGKVVGAPWRQDEKLCALAAWLVLMRRT